MSHDLVLRAGRVLCPDPVTGPGWIYLVDGRVEAVGAGTPQGRAPVLDLGADATVVPGLVDMHVHGGGGHRMTTDDVAEIRAAGAFHLAHGTTASVVSLVTAPLADLERQLATVAGLTRSAAGAGGRVLGAHLEGPFLSAARRGVHPPASLLAPEPTALTRLLDAADGTLRMVTLAPELPGSLGPGGAVERLCDQSVTVAIGHTDATHDVVTRAVDEGATVATHLCNGMRPLHHRDPGPIAALLERDEVTCELIADGVHVHPAVARLVADRCGDGRLALITDAVAASGAPDGTYRLGGVEIVRRDGRIELADGSSLGGSDLTMAAAVRHAVTDLGLPLAAAVAAATAVPAAAVGCADVAGRLQPGRAADLVVLDDELQVTGVMLGGEWIRQPAAARTEHAS